MTPSYAEGRARIRASATTLPMGAMRITAPAPGAPRAKAVVAAETKEVGIEMRRAPVSKRLVRTVSWLSVGTTPRSTARQAHAGRRNRLFAPVGASLATGAD